MKLHENDTEIGASYFLILVSAWEISFCLLTHHRTIDRVYRRRTHTQRCTCNGSAKKTF